MTPLYRSGCSVRVVEKMSQHQGVAYLMEFYAAGTMRGAARAYLLDGSRWAEPHAVQPGDVPGHIRRLGYTARDPRAPLWAAAPCR